MTTVPRLAVAALLAAAVTTACTGRPQDGGSAGTATARGRTADPTAAATNRGRATATVDTTPGRSMSDPQHRTFDERGRRTDLEPLTRRFAALGTPQSAAWVSGIEGNPRSIGPTTSFIEAVVLLTPETASALRARGGELTSRSVDVAEPLRADLPAGPFTGSRALDLALSSTRWSASGALAADGRTLVLRARGEG